MNDIKENFFYVFNRRVLEVISLLSHTYTTSISVFVSTFRRSVGKFWRYDLTPTVLVSREGGWFGVRYTGQTQYQRRRLLVEFHEPHLKVSVLKGGGAHGRRCDCSETRRPLTTSPSWTGVRIDGEKGAR